MDPGWIALAGIFALAAVCALWNFSHGRSIERRLAAQGFEPCDAEAPAIEATWRALTASNASEVELRVIRCRRRGGLYHFTVRERSAHQRASDDTANPGSSHPAYLLDAREPESLSRGAVTLCVLPPGRPLMRKLIAGMMAFCESWPRLDVGAHPWSAAIVAAHGETGGTLDDVVPAGVQEKIARAQAHGFFQVHLAKGKAAFVALPNHLDVDRQLAYLAEWT
jgi:hypothetical protein